MKDPYKDQGLQGHITADQSLKLYYFSLGFDVKDHYKDLGGDAAAYVAPRNDLQGVKVRTCKFLAPKCVCFYFFTKIKK